LVLLRPPISTIGEPDVPVLANSLCLDHIFAIIWEKSMCILLSFEDLGGQTKACMVGDMTVHEPVARIIGPERDNDETVPWQENDVASRRVLEIGLVVGFAKWFVLFLLENSKVVSMKMYL
jgi:hypothetical protein